MAFGLPTDRSFLSRRLIALPLLASSVVLGGAASALAVFGSALSRLFRDVVPVSGVAFSASWDALRWGAALVLMNLLLSVLYFLAPNRQSRWRWTSAGAVFATLTWALVSLGFSIYTSKFGSYGATYGAFAGVAILIFWLYLSGLAILVGAEVDAVIETMKDQEITVTPYVREVASEASSEQDETSAP
jgi:membrane protein